MAQLASVAPDPVQVWACVASGLTLRGLHSGRQGLGYTGGIYEVTVLPAELSEVGDPW